jgi:hypothetical protein
MTTKELISLLKSAQRNLQDHSMRDYAVEQIEVVIAGINKQEDYLAEIEILRGHLEEAYEKGFRTS